MTTAANAVKKMIDVGTANDTPDISTKITTN